MGHVGWPRSPRTGSVLLLGSSRPSASSTRQRGGQLQGGKEAAEGGGSAVPGRRQHGPFPPLPRAAFSQGSGTDRLYLGESLLRLHAFLLLARSGFFLILFFLFSFFLLWRLLVSLLGRRHYHSIPRGHFRSQICKNRGSEQAAHPKNDGGGLGRCGQALSPGRSRGKHDTPPRQLRLPTALGFNESLLLGALNFLQQRRKPVAFPHRDIDSLRGRRPTRCTDPTYSWRRPLGRGFSCSLRERESGRASARCSTPCPVGAGKSQERGRVLVPSPTADEAAHLLFEGHNRVDSEVSALAGIGDTNRSREEEPRGQDLKAAPTGQDVFG